MRYIIYYIQFQDGEYFTLPSNVSLSRVHKFRKMIDDFRNNRPTIKTTVATRPKDPSPTNFFQTITNCFQDVLKYENKELLKTAKSAVPIVRLQLEAMKKMRALQKEIKVKSTVAVNGPNIDGQNELSIEDILLAEIVHWFKNDFFTWVDSPSCNLCTGQCSFHRNEYRPDPTISRVEIHKCVYGSFHQLSAKLNADRPSIVFILLFSPCITCERKYFFLVFFFLSINRLEIISILKFQNLALLHIRQIVSGMTHVYTLSFYHHIQFTNF